ATLPTAFHQAAQAGFGIRRDYPQEAIEVAVIEHVPFAHQSRIIGQDLRRASHALLLALDFERIGQQASAHMQGVLNQADIFVASPEQGFNAAGDLYAGLPSTRAAAAKARAKLRGRGGKSNIYLKHTRTAPNATPVG